MRHYDEYVDIVERPGKFEGEEPYVPYFYDMAMEGAQDDVSFVGDMQIDWFRIDSEDARMFPELEDEVGDWVGIAEDYQGFIFEVDEREVEKAMKDYREPPVEVWGRFTGDQSVDEFMKVAADQGYTNVREAIHDYVLDIIEREPELADRFVDVEHVVDKMEEFVLEVMPREDLRDLGLSI